MTRKCLQRLKVCDFQLDVSPWLALRNLNFKRWLLPVMQHLLRRGAQASLQRRRLWLPPSRSRCSTDGCRKRLSQQNYLFWPHCCQVWLSFYQELPWLPRRAKTSILVHRGSRAPCGSACTASSYSFLAGPSSASARVNRGRTSTSQSIRMCRRATRICKFLS